MAEREVHRSIGMFHLFTHAFFKALLFLGSGSVIYAMHHEQDIRNMELGTVVALSAIFNLLFFVYPGPLVSAATAAAKSLF